MAVCGHCAAPLPEGARFCPRCAAPVEAAPTEERKVATVVFADLVGSTALAGEQDPERTRALLDRFYDAMTAEIEAAGGTVEKFAGDAVMAAFGAPTAQEDHAERALHASLSMRRRLDELFDRSLALRIGVNTGDVVVGRAREGSSFVSGDAVNVAARLEQAAAPGEILVGERTAAAARGAFELGEPRTVEAKGKPGGVRCRPLGRALSLMRPRGFAGLAAAFVGRELELGALGAAYDDVIARHTPRLVLLLGDSGIGKTRLVREFWARLGEREPEPVRRTGRCLSYGQGITYWPFGEILKEHLELLESDPPERVRERLGAHDILGLTLGLDVAGDLHPLAARDRLHEAWREFLSELTGRRPLVLLVEDLHWAEEPLLELLERAASGVRGPLLIVATARPELLDRWSWSPRVPVSQLLLEPLTSVDASRMVDALPAELRRLVVETAEGNPFFVEELVATLVDRGILLRENGRWSARELPAGFAVPDSVHAVLAARIDLLGPVEKAALQAAAVIGRVFWSGPVYELLEGQRPDLRVLEEREFILRRAGSSLRGETEFAIKHALTREVAYVSLPKARRARLHAAFARWLERVGEGRAEHASLLAHHYAEAVRPEDADIVWAGEDARHEELRRTARRWLRRAADLAVSRYELDDALELLQRALSLEDDRERRSELWHAIGRAHALKFDGEPFWTAMQRAIELSEDEARVADLYADLALETSGRAGMWATLPDRELVRGWIERAIDLAPVESVTRAKALIARSMWERAVAGTESGPAALAASELAERLGDPALRSMARICRLLEAFVGGDYDQALTWAERSFELVDDLNDPDLAADVHAAAALATTARARFREARRLASLHDDVTRKLTTHHRVHGVAIVAEVEELAGNWPRIRELEARIVETVEANLATPCVRNARAVLLAALAAEIEGDADRARELEQRAEELRMEGYGLSLDGPLVRLALLRGDLDGVARLLDQPLAARVSTWFHLSGTATRLEGFSALGDTAAVESEAARLVKPGTYLEPFALRSLGVVRQDDDLIRHALVRFEEWKLGWHAEQTRALLSK